MGTHFERKLEELHAQMIAIGNLCEQAITLSAEAVRGGGDQVVRQVFETDRDIDAKEREIEGQCMKLLLLQQPVAGDLRRISAALRMVADMERIGDHATDISELAIVLSELPHIEQLTHIEQMAKETMVMLIQGVEAYVERNYDKAEQVIKHDDVIDNLFLEVKQELIDVMREKPDCANQAADLLMVAKYFERIGDHAANIAEWAIFSVTGKHE